MIKFSLTLWVCSFLGTQSVCLPPIPYPQVYESWYHCTRAAHSESLQLISKLGYKYINDNKIAMRYVCKLDTSI